MPTSILWDLDDDPNGNVQHCAEHGVTKEEVEEVFENVSDMDISRSTGRPVVFGDTRVAICLWVSVHRSIAKSLAIPGGQAQFPADPSLTIRIVFGRKLSQSPGCERLLLVVYETIDSDTVYPVTAYDVPRRQGQ